MKLALEKRGSKERMGSAYREVKSTSM